MRFEGVSLKGQPTEMIARRGLSLVPEGRQVFTRLKVEENLRLAAGLAGTVMLDDVYRRSPFLRHTAILLPATCRVVSSSSLRLRVLFFRGRGF